MSSDNGTTNEDQRPPGPEPTAHTQVVAPNDLVEKDASDTDDKGTILFQQAHAFDASSTSTTRPWQEDWFVDGRHATVEYRNDDDDDDASLLLYFAAGTVTKQQDPEHYQEHHAVLWTRQVFDGNVRVSFDMTRLDTSDYGTVLFYIQAQGIGTVAPYERDIYAWRDLRQVSSMDKYYNTMNLLSISLRENIRCKRYPWNNVETGQPNPNILLPPMVDYETIVPHQSYHVVLEKRNPYLTLRLYRNDDKTTSEKTCLVDTTWDQRDCPELQPWIETGRIGIRHMSTRQHLYRNFQVTQL